MKKNTAVKLMSLVLALVLCLAVFGGCDKKSGDGEVYEIVWYNLGDTTKDHELVNEKINEYLKEKIGATVKMINFGYADYEEKMKLIMNTGEEFDLCRVVNFANNVDGGAYLPLDDLLKSHGQGILEVLPEYAWNVAKYDGEIFAAPSNKDWGTQYVIGCKKDLVEKYNFDLSNVKTLADMEPFLEIIKKNEPTYYPTDLRGNDYIKKLLPFEHINNSVLGAFDLHGDYSKVVNWIETDTAKEFFDMMHSWYQKGYLRPDADTATTSNDIKFFMNCMELIPYQEQQLNAEKDLDEQRVFINIEEPIITTSYIQASMQAISRTSKNPEKTMEFLNLLYTDEYLHNLYVYGIEGQHYFLEEDGVTIKYPEGVKASVENDYYGTAYTQGNRYLLKLSPGSPADLWDAYEKFNEASFKSPMLGFTFDISALSSEIAAMNNVYKQYMPGLTTGVLDPKTALPEAIEKFKIAGSEKVFKELQSQYDEWKKNNK